MFFIRRACLTFPANAYTRQSIALLRHSRPTRRRSPVGVRKSCRLAEPLRLTAFGTSPFRGGFVPEGAPRTLFERVSVAEGLKPFVNDYRVNVFEVPRLTAEQVGQFKSDFRIVADYFVQMGRDEDYVPPRQTIEHVDAVLKLMSALTRDHRFEETQSEFRKGEAVTMLSVLDKVEARGIQLGEAKGIAATARRMLGMNFTSEQISQATGLSPDEVAALRAGTGN